MRKIVARLFISDLLKFMDGDTPKAIKSSAIRRKQAIAVTTSAARSGPDSGRMTPNPVMEELPTSQNRCILCNALRSGQRNGHHREGGQFESSVVRCYIFIGDT